MSEMKDMFGDVPQPERQAAPRAKPLTVGDVRAQMEEILAALRGADSSPFEPPVMARHIAMFPIMAQWLDEEEGEQLCFEFAREIERLKLAA